MTALVVFTAGWALGSVVMDAALVHPAWFLLLLPVAMVVGYAWRTPLARKVTWALFGILAGAARLYLAQPVLDEAHVAFYRGRGPVTLVGKVIAEPDVRPMTSYIRVRAESLALGENAAQPVRGLVLVQLPPYTPVAYGDRLALRGQLEEPPVLEGFSYRDYLARRGIYVQMLRPTLQRLASHQGNPGLDLIYRFKAQAWRTLLRLLPEPQASLLAGILLGIESGIPHQFQEAFAATGTSHIVAISGFNISIIAGVFAALARRVGRGKAEFWLATGGVALYTLLVGASASVLRAALMGSVVLASRALDRRVHGPTSLATAALGMALLDAHVWWDAGFLLSLSATAGLLLFTDPLTHLFLRSFTRWLGPGWGQRLVGWLSDALIVTLAAQITTTPIILALFKRLSLITLLTNFLILPAQPWVMLLGGVALIAGLLWFPLGQVLSWGAWVFLTYTIEVVKLTARLPWASVPFELVSVPVIWGYYAGLASLLAWQTMTPARRWRWLARLRRLPGWAWVGTFTVLVLLVVALVMLPDGKTHVTILAVGQGDAVLIRTPTGRQVLVDGGPDPTRTLEVLGRFLPFWERHLDGVILTAPMAERLNGLLPVLDRYRVDYVLTAPMTGTTALETPWRAALASRPPDTVGVLYAGGVWSLDASTRLRVLWPPADTSGPLVLQVDTGPQQVLLAGAATTVVEQALVATWGEALRAQVLLVPRHAAATAATPDFLRMVAPEVVCITLGEGQEPAPEALVRLVDWPVYRTDRDGSIELILKEHSLRVRTHR